MNCKYLSTISWLNMNIDIIFAFPLFFSFPIFKSFDHIICYSFPALGM